MEFTIEYQHELLRKMNNPSFLTEVGKMLSPDMFEGELEELASEMIKRFQTTGKVLTKGQLQQLCKKHQVKLRSGVSGDYTFDLEEVRRYRESRILGDALAKAHLYRDSGHFDKAYNTILTARNRLSGDVGQVADILDSSRPMPVRKNIIPTAIPELDEYLQGGVAAGDLAVVLAPTSGGKTSLLVWLACQAALTGKRVFYATLEVSEHEIEAKLRRCICGSEYSKKVWAVVSKKLKKKGAVLSIKEAPPRSISAGELDLQIPHDVDVVIVDYGDYLRADSGSERSSYEDLGQIYTSLKQIGMKRRIPIWTASQTNRASYQDSRLGVETVESSLRKVMLADQVITINQDKAERGEDDSQTATLHIAKNRHGARFVDIPVTVDWATSTFKSGKWAE